MVMAMDTAMAMEKVAKNVNNERNIRNQKRGVNVLWINLQVMADEY